tara:strand:+ start:492 stop:1514 length:1023 start_codon:yes stop_codon:yes gene_type:complete
MVALLEEYNPSLAKTDPPAKKCSTENFCDSDNRVEKLLSQAQDLRPMKVVLSYETASGHSYGPFGELVSQTGSYSTTNTYKFSTKPQDAETGYYYYGFRYYDSSNGRWLNRDPITERGGFNLYAIVGNETLHAVDMLGLKTCQSISFSASIPATKGKIRLARPFYLKVGGSLSIQVSGEKCTECCPDSGKEEETWNVKATVSGAVTVTGGVGEDIDVSYGNFSITGFAGAQATGSLTASGSGSFERPCGGSAGGSGSGTVSGGFNIKGGASLEAKVKKGRWEFDFAKTSATISGGGSVSADYQFTCNSSGCTLDKFGDYSAKASATAEACALGYCISHTF